MTARTPVETSRNSDTSKYRCTAGSGGALMRAVEAIGLLNDSSEARGPSATAWGECSMNHVRFDETLSARRLRGAPAVASASAAASFFVALETGTFVKLFSAKTRERGSFGNFGTRARNGNRVILRNVTPWRADGSSSRTSFRIPNVSAKYFSNSDLASRET